MQEKYLLPQNIYDYTEPELQKFRELCNFTENELILFDLKAKGETIVQIARDMCVSESTVANYTRKVKKKMLKVIEKL